MLLFFFCLVITSCTWHVGHCFAWQYESSPSYRINLLAINAKQLWSFIFLTHIIQVMSSAQEFTRTAEYREQELGRERQDPFRKNVVPVPAHAPQNMKRYSRAILSTRESTSTGKSCTTAWTTSIRRGTQYPSGLPLREEAEVETRIPEAIDEVLIRRMETNCHERATVVDTERISDHSVGSFSTRSGSEFDNLRFWRRFSLLDTESDT
ncbi:hypothetical protein C8J57DRAFT_1229435 [Mycena rebaudengoi]|nr:hypothetical protein C8J57DRAFT_1229435 [Mycena rebaudengoi]